MSDHPERAAFSLNCQQVDLLLSEYIEDDPDMDPQERMAVSAHFAVCQACQEKLEADREIIAFAKGHWEEITSDASIPDEDVSERLAEDSAGREEFDVEARWQDLLQRCPELAARHAEQAAQNRRRVCFVWGLRLSAIAAAVFVVFGLGWFIRGLTTQVPVNLTSTSSPVPTPVHHDSNADMVPQDITLVSVVDGAVPPAPNLDKLDYQQWRDSHREWFSQQFPWIFKAQEALAEKGVQADYIDLLIASGDIWQFSYRSDETLDQPIAVLRQDSVERLAKAYAVDSHWLATKILDGQQLSPSSSTDSAVLALGQWQRDLLKAADQPEGISTNLLIVSFRASAFVAENRTAAYLWGKAHPHELQSLVWNHLESHEVIGGSNNANVSAEDFCSLLVKQAKAAYRVRRITEALISLPPKSGCVPTTGSLRQQLKDNVLTISSGK